MKKLYAIGDVLQPTVIQLIYELARPISHTYLRSLICGDRLCTRKRLILP